MSPRFGQRGSAGFAFRAGSVPHHAKHIDFLEEYERGSSHDFRIESILWIASVREPDVALLRLRADLVVRCTTDPDASQSQTRPASPRSGTGGRQPHPDQDLVSESLRRVRKEAPRAREVTGARAMISCTTAQPSRELRSVLVISPRRGGRSPLRRLYKQANYAVSALA